MGDRCPECGAFANVDSLCTWEINAAGERVAIGDFQPDDEDSAHCTVDACGWEGTYGDLI